MSARPSHARSRPGPPLPAAGSPGPRRRPSRASEQRPPPPDDAYRLFFEANPRPLWVLDGQTLAILAVNDAAVRHYGYSREEFLRLTLLDLAPAHGRDRLRAFARGVFGRPRHSGFAVHLRSDGSRIDVETEWNAIDYEGRRAWLVGVEDVTQERMAGRGALASANLRAVALSLGRRLGACQTPAEVARVIAAGAQELWTCSDCAVDRYDAAADRVWPVLRVKRRGEEWIESEVSAEQPLDELQGRALRDGTPLLFGASEGNGSEAATFAGMLTPIRDHARVLGFVRILADLPAYTETDLASLQGLADFCGESLARIETTEELRRRERQLREAQAAGRIGSWEWDLADGTLHWSDELYRIFGVARSDFEGTLEWFFERVVFEDRDRLAAITRESLTDYRPFEVEYRIVRGDGEIRTIAARSHFVTDQDRSTRRAIGIAQDVTDRKKAEADLQESRERLVALSKRLIAVQETERARIARELHDEIGQALTALKINLQVAGKPGDADEDRNERLADSLRIVETAIRQVRDISLALRPSLLDDLGLVSALRWYVDSQAQRAGLQTHFEANPTEIRVPSDLEIGAYRIVQEALTNVVRHAKATRVEARIERTGKKLRLSIRDNGVGFDVAAARQRAKRGSSLGLLTMSERARLLGGALAIHSTPGRGVEVRVTLPIEEAS